MYLLCVVFSCFCMWLYVVVWHANDPNEYAYVCILTRGRLGGCMGGCECKLNANVLVVDWNGTERCCDVAAVGVGVRVAMVVMVILPTLVPTV